MTPETGLKRAVYHILPVPKPRMTKRDRWAQRDCVMRYWDFCDEVRRNKVQLPDSGAHIIFTMPFPESWSAKKKIAMVGKPHTQRPDLDNLIKALKDAIFGEDCHIWDYRATKVWGDYASIEIRERAGL